MMVNMVMHMKLDVVYYADLATVVTVMMTLGVLCYDDDDDIICSVLR